MVFELTADNAVGYLADRGLIGPAEARMAEAELLGGGVSNVVVRVNFWDGGDGGRGGLALKQSLPKLRVEGDWFADRERIYRERAGIDWLRGVLPEGAVPRVMDEDRKNFLFVMTAAPRDWVNWKEALLAGIVDSDVAGQVGEMLGVVHQASVVEGDAAPAELRELAGLDCFVQLRIDPYHRATAAAHPDLAGVIEEEARRMLGARDGRRVLAHGDYSPKNVIVSGGGATARAFLLDFEAAHLGNPVFDPAFMLNHFTLKAIYRPELAERYNEAVRSFWRAYVAAAGEIADDSEALERDTVRQMGALLLARIDGKSPVEYITEDAQKSAARALAASILRGDAESLSDVHGRLAA